MTKNHSFRKLPKLVNLKQWNFLMNFDIINKITEIETIAKGTGIRELNRLRKFYGLGKGNKPAIIS